MARELKGYELSRKWFNWCFENPEKIVPAHTALYFFIIDQCNRLGWKEKFGLPTDMAKEAIGIKNYRTYINTLNDLVAFGFILMIEKSKNQYTANIVALVDFTKADTKALDKAGIKHNQSTYQSIDSIDKQETIKQPTSNNLKERKKDPSLPSFENLSPEELLLFNNIAKITCFNSSAGNEIVTKGINYMFGFIARCRSREGGILYQLKNLSSFEKYALEDGIQIPTKVDTMCNKLLETKWDEKVKQPEKQLQNSKLSESVGETDLAYWKAVYSNKKLTTASV